MGPLNIKRLYWAFNRQYLRRGAVAGIALGGAVCVLTLLVSLGWSRLRLERAGEALAASVGELRAGRGEAVPRAQAETLPLPDATRRFDLNRQFLVALKRAGFEPEQIRFKFETAEEAGLTRQIAVFTLKARWGDIARVLSQLQAVDRAIYISKLRVLREHADDEQVAAEIQLAVALVDGESDAGATP